MDASWFIVASSLGLSFLILYPLGHKWELDKKITTPTILLIGVFSGMLIAVFGANVTPLNPFWIVIAELFLIGASSISLILWRFYRDPERTAPQDDRQVVSPADGTVIYIKPIENGEVPVSEKKGATFKLQEFTDCDVLPQGGYLIGIAMSFLDVHVNRAPMEGKVTLLKKISGLFLSLKEKKALLTNERAVVVIDNGEFKIGLVQIASRLVRNIVAFVEEGAAVAKGDRIGMIRFGSQVDVVVPDLADLKICVNIGDYVYAGESTLVTIGKTDSSDEKGGATAREVDERVLESISS